MVTEKKNFFSNAQQHSFAKGKVISECKNDKPWKNEIRKVSIHPFLRRPAPRPYLHPLF